MVSNFTDERLEELEELYASLCPDSLKVTIDMIEALIIRTGKKVPSNFTKKIQALLDRVDPENDGTVDIYHFCEICYRSEAKKTRKKRN
jgi:hypothetical protein